ncbi:AMP-binding protein [Paraburkholderia sp. RL17-337-BIB-A]|uniref:AMP-binding protein n=1 Tax=Paraburkholderia sp. RL17-337-BIB-A TaxID=3031636 RepID=UPI0038B7C563
MPCRCIGLRPSRCDAPVRPGCRRLHTCPSFLIWDLFDGQGRTYSYADLLDHVQRLAGGMAARGVRAGDRVVVHMENCPEAVLVRFACAWLGAVCVATNALAAGPELAYLVAAACAVCAVTQSHLAPLLAEHCSQLAWIAVVNAEVEDGERAVAAQRVFDFSRLYVRRSALRFLAWYRPCPSGTSHDV